MKRFLLTTISLTSLAASSVYAADLPSVKAAAAAPVPIWSGFYVGLNAGGTWGNSNNVQFSNFPAYANPALKSAPYQLAIVSLTGNVSVPTNSSASFIGGGQIGYNHQLTSDFLIGIETDIQGIINTGNGTSNIFQITNYTFLNAATGSQLSATLHNLYSASKSIDYIGTVRGRIGYLATPTIQIFGTAGLAYGGVNVKTSHEHQAFTEGTGGEAGPGSAILSGTLVGWTAGGGVEWMFAPNWSAKVEYLYYDLGSKQLYNGSMTRVWDGNPVIAGISEGDIASSSVSVARTNFNGNIVRAGVNYHFNFANAAPVVAKF